MCGAKVRSKKPQLCHEGVRALRVSPSALLGVNLTEPLRAQNSIKAWSVLQKDQYPQNGGEDAWTDRRWRHREMEGKDVEDFSGQEDERQAVRSIRRAEAVRL